MSRLPPDKSEVTLVHFNSNIKQILEIHLSIGLFSLLISGLYGVLFPNNPSAFGAATIGQTGGLLLGSVVTLFTCVNVKTYVYLGIILASLVGFVSIEIRTKLKSERAASNRDKDILIKLDSLDFISDVRF